jgi:alcohol dehydrogenase
VNPAFIEFFCPVKIIAGSSALEHLPFELSARGVSKPIIVTDRGVRGAGLVAQLQGALASANVPCDVVYDDVPPDSSTGVVTAITHVYRREGCDGIIAIGGGSVIDTAKAVNILVSEGGDDLLAYSGTHGLKRRLKPLFVLPTTSGTGSEVTIVSVVKDSKTGMKAPFMSQYLLPDVAVLDPRLTVGLPPYFTAATAMDAMTHAVEAFTCIGKNALSDAYASAAIQKISANVVQVLDAPTDTSRRLELAVAATMAGIAFSNSMVGLVHALGHTVGSIAHVPHGVCMSIFLPYVLEYNLPARSEIIGELLLPLAGADVYASTRPEARAQAAIAKIRSIRDVLWEKAKLPRTLSETGKVDRKQLPEIAKHALDDGAMLMNPVDVTYEQALAVLERSY